MRLIESDADDNYLYLQDNDNPLEGAGGCLGFFLGCVVLWVVVIVILLWLLA